MKKQTSYFKKAIVVLMAVMMIFTMMPSMAFAEDGSQTQSEGKATYGYVTDISFGCNRNGTNDPANPQGYSFSVEQTSYDIAVTNINNGQNPIKISVHDSYAGKTGEEQLYAAVYLDDETTPLKIANKKYYIPLANKDKEFVNGTLQLKKAIEFGKMHTLTIRVGRLADLSVSDKDRSFKGDEYDEYVYHVSMRNTFSQMVVKSGDDVLELTPTYHSGNTEETTYSVMCAEEDIKLNIGTNSNKAQLEVYAGDKELEFDVDNEINLKPYMQGDSGISVIPLLIRQKGTSASPTETNYILNVCKEDISPVITEQTSGPLAIGKDNTEPLTVTVSEPKMGELSYQWYETNAYGESSNTKEIEGATQSSYLPDVKYAGTYYYKCRITNSVGSYSCFTDSEIVKVEVSMSSLGAPSFAAAPTNYGNMGSTTYYSNAMPIIDIKLGDLADLSANPRTKEGASVSVALYRNKINSTENGELVNCDVVYNAPTYTFALPSQEVDGEYYYYAVATASMDGYDDVSEASKTLKLTYNDPKTVVKGLDGEGSTDKPFLIKDLKDLNYINQLIKTGFTFDGQSIQLVNDIALPSDWEPIGVLKSGAADEGKGINVIPFMGVFDGANNTVTVAEDGLPLFNYVRRATIKNLNIYGTHIKGYGLIDKYYVDYGDDGTYIDNILKLRTVDISNVIIKKDSKVLKAGFIGGYASGDNAVNISDCIVEKGVTIGDDGSWGDLGETTRWGYPFVTGSSGDKFVNEEYFTHKDCVGSFGGAFNGTINNSISYATVYGNSFVGGLIGMKGQSMGPCDVTNSAFCGKIIAEGKRVGGIIGGGYIAPSAPDTPAAVVKNSYAAADIQASGKLIGGIVGAGYTLVDNTFFYGTISGGNELSPIGAEGENNYYLAGCGCSAEDEKYGISRSTEQFADGTVLAELSKLYTNWQQDEKYPIVNDKPTVSSIVLKGGYKTNYYVGDSLSTNKLEVYAHWTDGEETLVDLNDVTISGFDGSKAGHQTVTVKYKAFKATYEVDIKYSSPRSIKAYITIYGDEVHDSDDDGEVHTLSQNNLDLWVGEIPVSIDQNTTVKDVLEEIAGKSDIKLTAQPNSKYGYYLQGMEYNEEYLGEFTNGKLSGWMYTVNGTHPQISSGYYMLSDGDKIVWHYTDDYTVEEGADKWGIPGTAAAEEVKEVSSDKSAATTTSPTDVKVSETTNADGTKETVATASVSSDNQKEILAQAKSNKSKEIILQVSKDSVKDATKVDVQLDKSFIESVANAGASLTVKTPLGDKTYTNAELKELAAEASGKTVSIEIVKSEKTDEELKTEQLEAAKATAAKASMKARSSKTAKGNITIVFKPDTKTQNFINEMKDMGYTVKYRFYRSTKKSSGYKSMLTKTSKTYTNTSGKVGTRYYYKVQVRVYDENGKCVAKTALKQCKYATRIFG